MASGEGAAANKVASSSNNEDSVGAVDIDNPLNHSAWESPETEKSRDANLGFK
jgi:hypothetical protein